MDFKPIDRPVCSECGRAETSYYDRRKEHMAAAFRSGVPVQVISAGYGLSMDWSMKLITEQMGAEAVHEVVSVYRIHICEMCRTPVGPEDPSEWVNDKRVHADCLLALSEFHE